MPREILKWKEKCTDAYPNRNVINWICIVRGTRSTFSSLSFSGTLNVTHRYGDFPPNGTNIEFLKRTTSIKFVITTVPIRREAIRSWMMCCKKRQDQRRPCHTDDPSDEIEYARNSSETRLLDGDNSLRLSPKNSVCLTNFFASLLNVMQ